MNSYISNYKTRNSIIPIIVLMVFFSLLFWFCAEDWSTYYSSQEATVDISLQDAIKNEPRYSLFVHYIQKYGLDTLFDNQKSFTLFIPPNQTLETVPDTGNMIYELLKYHISPSVILLRNVQEKRKIITESGKFITIEADENEYTFEGIPVVFESPLYKNGKFYEIIEPAIPKLNLYEYTKLFSEVISNYIDLQDSVYLDLNKSKPIGFDTLGNTIYDTVMANVNLFEKYYFPVKKEIRDRSATFILFTQAQYQEALNEMSEKMSNYFNSWEDIPQSWQNEVLLPEMMRIGLFENSLSYDELVQDSLLNVRGEKVKSSYDNIDPESRFDCSNGVVYNYSTFSVPDDMYLNSVKTEGEDLVDSIGAGRFAWKSDVKVSGASVEPVRQFTSFESLVNVDLGRNYKGSYTVEFTMEKLWPVRYRLVLRANYRPSGIYAIYINGVKIGQFDTYTLRSSILSVTGERFLPASNGFNKKDFWVDHITQYGDISIKFEYMGSGGSATNGFNMDYVELIPVLE